MFRNIGVMLLILLIMATCKAHFRRKRCGNPHVGKSTRDKTIKVTNQVSVPTLYKALDLINKGLGNIDLPITPLWGLLSRQRSLGQSSMGSGLNMRQLSVTKMLEKLGLTSSRNPLEGLNIFGNANDLVRVAQNQNNPIYDKKNEMKDEDGEDDEYDENGVKNLSKEKIRERETEKQREREKEIQEEKELEMKEEEAKAQKFVCKDTKHGRQCLWTE